MIPSHSLLYSFVPLVCSAHLRLLCAGGTRATLAVNVALVASYGSTVLELLRFTCLLTISTMLNRS